LARIHLRIREQTDVVPELNVVNGFGNGLWLYVATGFAAQLVGSLVGMGYGTISSAVLLSLGVTPSMASASANAASFVTTTVASLFHYKHGNVDLKTMLYLAVPGVVGSVCGALVVMRAPVEIIKPIVGVYLIAITLMIVWKTLHHYEQKHTRPSQLIPLGLIGGALGSIGGGGWGPIVNSHLVANGHSPQKTVGSSNAAKCFANFAAVATFFAVLKTCDLTSLLGLIIGGLVAAPLAACLCKQMPARALLVSMAVLLSVISGRMVFAL
jgi:uncharacterized membrane protein YfcA